MYVISAGCAEPGLESVLVCMPLLSIRTARRLSTAFVTADMSTTTIRVVDDPSEERKVEGRPAHWTSDKPVWFQNPWPSWRMNGKVEGLGMVRVLSPFQYFNTLNVGL